MMGCGVTEGAGGGTCQREIVDQEPARLLCLEYTFVLSIFLLLSVTTLSMSSSHISSCLNSVRSVHTNKMKENHHIENEPQTTWLNV